MCGRVYMPAAPLLEMLGPQVTPFWRADAPLLTGALAALSLQACFFPTAALLPMRAHMPRLTRLSMDLTSNEGSVGLEALLLLLCRPHAGAVQLECLTCTCMEVVVDAEAVRGSVLQQLGSCFGVTGVVLEVVRLVG